MLFYYFCVVSKLKSIMSGWSNLVFETPEVKAMAESRAKICGKCANSVKGWVAEFIDDKIVDVRGRVCKLCNCPNSAKIRSPYEKCPIGLWQEITK